MQQHEACISGTNYNCHLHNAMRILKRIADSSVYNCIRYTTNSLLQLNSHSSVGGTLTFFNAFRILDRKGLRILLGTD